MPATEQTWRDSKLLHVVFGLSSLAMLITTIWMLAVDHQREWKGVQEQFREVETWTAVSRINEEASAEYYARERKLEARLDRARTQVPRRASIEGFLEAARSEVPAGPETGSPGQATSRALDNGYDLQAVEDAYRRLVQAAHDKAESGELIERRDELVSALAGIVLRAEFDEKNRQGALKFKKAELDSERSLYDIAVEKERPAAELATLQRQVDEVNAEVERLTIAWQEAKTHRTDLEKKLQVITAREAAARKFLDDHHSQRKRLEEALKERQVNWGKQFLASPVLDAFGRPLKIDQIWLPNLPMFNNFRDVARFDRCTTCHLGMDKTAAGSATQPLYEPVEILSLTLATPDLAPSLKPEEEAQVESLRADRDDEAAREQTLEIKLVATYGLELAERGLIEADDVTASVVRPRSLAAKALLKPGDVIQQINDVKILDKSQAYRYLLESVKWGQPLALAVRRGVPQPFSSHPRLDLFIGSLSPHKMGEFGCTICHEGQGSGTAFKWASHTPNSPAQMADWQRQHGWFNNHHWIFPMLPERFRESSCLKCHHDVTELEPSERFPDPPAPKLVEGYHLIRQYGCFGCHEINGFDGPTKRRGPDLRAEPNYHAAAAQLLGDPGLGDKRRVALARDVERKTDDVEENPENDEAQKRLPAARERLAELDQLRALARQVSEHPDEEESRKLLAELVVKDAGRTEQEGGRVPVQLTPASHKLATILGADEATPGKLRKVGPSLRYVKSKVDLAFLYNWIRNPRDFRPTTRMPRFFGLDDHLLPDEKLASSGEPVLDAHGHPVLEETQGLGDAKRFEPIEIRAISEYLLWASQPWGYIDFPQNVTQQPSARRGKELFQTRGCLACHQHSEKDFHKAGLPELTATQGPDLSRIGAKLRTTNGERWLYSWLRDPSHYHARTLMPNLHLEPITRPDGTVTDPADDIAAFLLTYQGDKPPWKPKAVPEIVESDLDELALAYLSASFTHRQSEQYLAGGIPDALAGEIKPDEAVLLGEGRMTLEKKLLYVGRRSISRLGCAGCHDIPGLEEARPIGTGLADWGRKETSKLAFEQIVPYLARRHAASDHGGSAHGGGGLSPREMKDADEGFFIDALLNHQREGFLWQKLREPRSYDYKKTENKPYTDRLRMPKFNFTGDQIEAVMTFVLGLVAEPPPARYVYRPSPRRQAIVDGEQVLAKYNCGGCHTLAMETWKFEYDPDTFPQADPFTDYAFLLPHFTPGELAESGKVDQRGWGQAVVTGMPNPQVDEDDEGDPLYYFGLWKPAAINGQVWPVGGKEVPVPEARLVEKRPPRGGDFARYLHPVAVEQGKKANPNVKPSDVWGWVPPPLVREGQKVQTDWLHEFLLKPYPIRPAVLLRMPRFNMSSAEAGKLVNYFAAVDQVEYPYEYSPRTQSSALSPAEMERLDQALNIVSDRKTYCLKCHMLGDFDPATEAAQRAAEAAAAGAEDTAASLAPNLDQVHRRLRPGYLRQWLANPQRKLPYTGMPVNFPPHSDPNEVIRKELFPGTSQDALEAVADLLLNYDAFMKSRTSIKLLLEKRSPQAAGRKAASAQSAAAGN